MSIGSPGKQSTVAHSRSRQMGRTGFGKVRGCVIGRRANSVTARRERVAPPVPRASQPY